MGNHFYPFPTGWVGNTKVTWTPTTVNDSGGRVAINVTAGSLPSNAPWLTVKGSVGIGYDLESNKPYPEPKTMLAVNGTALVTEDFTCRKFAVIQTGLTLGMAPAGQQPPPADAPLKVFGPTELYKSMITYGTADVMQSLTTHGDAEIKKSMSVGTSNADQVIKNPSATFKVYGTTEIASSLLVNKGAEITGKLTINTADPVLTAAGAQGAAVVAQTTATNAQGAAVVAQATATNATQAIDEIEAALDPLIHHPELKFNVDPRTFLREPMIRVQGGFIAQVDGTIASATEKDPNSLDLTDKFITLGTSPFLPNHTAVANPPRKRKTRYGLTIHWPTKSRAYFTTLQLEEKNGGPTKDAVITWGKQKRSRFIFRFIGKLKNSKNRTGDVIVVQPTGHVRVYGSVTSHFHELSDVRFKTSIEPIPGALNKVMAMRGIHYAWKRDEYPHENFSDRRQLGLIAQEVEAICPELVSKDPESGHKTIDYTRVTPVLVEAIKDQQKIIEAQQARLDRLEEALRKLGALS